MTTGVGRREPREAGEVYTIEECVHVYMYEDTADLQPLHSAEGGAGIVALTASYFWHFLLYT